MIMSTLAYLHYRNASFEVRSLFVGTAHPNRTQPESVHNVHMHVLKGRWMTIWLLNHRGDISLRQS